MKNKIILDKNDELIVASHNQGKVKEINILLQSLGIKTSSISKYSNKEPIEDGLTFEENALIKAQSANNLTGMNSLSDDSGLCIEALNGKPGIYSARWAGPNKSFDLAMTKIEKLLKDKQNKNAYFVCALALVTKNKKSFCFIGTVKGKISFPPKGTNGFGYDPIFIPDNYRKSFGEMLPSEKDIISHRSDAFKKFKEALIVR